MRKIALIAIAAGLSATAPAGAAVITTTINFSTTDFIDVVGNLPPPVSLVTGSFTVTFDTGLNYLSDTTDIIVNNFSGVTVASPFGFTYDSGSHFFWFGGTQNQSNYVSTGTDDFVLTLDLTNVAAPRSVTCADPGIQCANKTGDVGVLASGYTTISSGTGFFQKAAATVVTSGVPEPASWAMMIAGFAGIGLSLRRQKRQMVCALA